MYGKDLKTGYEGNIYLVHLKEPNELTFSHELLHVGGIKSDKVIRRRLGG